ncbi:3-hydroxyacyl-CoA dehydrogenase NAD-binding domain-containing protein, partial [Bifidobacterium pseudocatenulatum]|nr:3-hydroxyacyl-CoA dehydrogenase NAD-binding domain-containing protein [Bifidobacterium pseudocatenulatum]
MKKDFYAQLCSVLPKEAIIASNSSTYVPSQLVQLVDRPAKFLHLHFANHIWVFNTAGSVLALPTISAVLKT